MFNTFSRHQDNVLIGVMWCVFIVVLLLLRPLTPIDETRYLTVAWEMYQSGDWFVPTKNGDLYTDKPPLLFWLINIVWLLFGVSEFVARILAPVFALLSVIITTRIAAMLFVDKHIVKLTSWLLLGCIFWSFSNTIVKFDTLIMFATVSGVWALLNVALKGKKWSWLIFALAIAFGGLAKGPVILLHLLPLALFVPLIFKNHQIKHWYMPLLLSSLLGIALVLLWAIPAAIIGGEAYSDAIFINQTLQRIGNANGEINAHHLPFWWYLPMLLLTLLPWSLMRAIWRNIRQLTLSPAIVFLLMWAGVPLLLFSLISGKQMFYLLPEFIPIMLLFAVALSHHNTQVKKDFPLAALFLIVALISMVLPNYQSLPLWTDDALIWFSGLFFALAVVFILPYQQLLSQLKTYALVMLGAIVALHLILFDFANSDYNVKPLARLIASKQAQGFKVAHFAKYHGQYQFVGRLTEPLVAFHGWQHEESKKWLIDHPNDYVIVYQKIKSNEKERYQSPHRFPYAGETVLMLQSNALLAQMD